MKPWGLEPYSSWSLAAVPTTGALVAFDYLIRGVHCLDVLKFVTGGQHWHPPLRPHTHISSCSIFVAERKFSASFNGFHWVLQHGSLSVLTVLNPQHQSHRADLLRRKRPRKPILLETTASSYKRGSQHLDAPWQLSSCSSRSFEAILKRLPSSFKHRSGA